MGNVDRSWFSIEAQSTPVPKFECKDVWRGADLQHNAILTGTVYRSRRNQNVIVLTDRPLLNMLLRIELCTRSLRGFQFFDHVFRNYFVFQSQVNMCTFFYIHQVVALILSVLHPE